MPRYKHAVPQQPFALSSHIHCPSLGFLAYFGKTTHQPIPTSSPLCSRPPSGGFSTQSIAMAQAHRTPRYRDRSGGISGASPTKPSMGPAGAPHHGEQWTQRTKSGCWTCRFRAKGCPDRADGGRVPSQSCQTCQRLQIECLGYGEEVAPWMTQGYPRSGLELVRELLSKAHLRRLRTEDEFLSFHAIYAPSGWIPWFGSSDDELFSPGMSDVEPQIVGIAPLLTTGATSGSGFTSSPSSLENDAHYAQQNTELSNMVAVSSVPPLSSRFEGIQFRAPPLPDINFDDPIGDGEYPDF
ncbi:hypothetical protein DL93DRAFT_964594 [Clavulina sp. PMI_390]|nr:hypothetical protein DL93DRAFT_964594 [Clavulina sp. PMI_390]